MPYFVGYDGGGTKTECVLLEATGHVLSQATVGPSNPLRVGYEKTFAALAEAAARTLAPLELQPGDVSVVGAGLAGAGRADVAAHVRDYLAQHFAQAFVYVTSDLEIALEATAGAGPGVVLIAGTGSAACGRNAGGQTARAGGHGPWVGDEGSAFDIGRQAVAAVALARDLGIAPPRLAERVLRAAGCRDWDELIERIAESPDSVFPAVFPAVVAAAEAKDATARDILECAAQDLASLAQTIVRRLALADQEFPLAKSGGVFGRSMLLDARLDKLLAAAAPRAKITMLAVPPAAGAARLAWRLAGVPSARGATHAPDGTRE